MSGKGEEKLWLLLNDKLETLRSGGQLGEALRVAETALDLARRVFPPGDRHVAVSLERLGQLHDDRRQPADAKPLLLEALRMLETAPAPDRGAIYRGAWRLAFLCDSLGDQAEAVRYYEKAIEAGEDLPGVAYSELGTMLNNVAMIYKKAGHPEAAEPYYLRALAIYEKQLGAEHADVASVLNNLAVFYTNAQRFDEAEEMHLRALAIRRQVHPPGHPDVAQSQCNLAVVYHSRGDLEQAASLYRESLEAWEKTADSRSEDYEIVAANYADLLRATGKERKAAAVEARVQKRRRSG